MPFIKRCYPASVDRVWSVFVGLENPGPDEPGLWSFDATDYEPVAGQKFSLRCLPILGTRFNGNFDCKVITIEPQRLWATTLEAEASRGPSAQWVQQVEFTDHYGGTLLNWNLSGVQTADPHERFLHRFYSGSASQALTDLGNYLERTRPQLWQTAR